ncbi:glycosyltransferase [Paenibacillus sp. NPDC056579]|uniref:glycosyltransferase n=1 Tax=Paenibacillus sp. NPDC056579 TaxID=3345871 RepID=UPI0036CF7A8F
MGKLLSLCMIVKNEEKLLKRCLDSIADLVDEIVITDTGSTDRTKEIAYQYTDKVYDFTWTNDFAAARNHGIQHAEGRWILWLDADEYVSNNHKEGLRTLLKNLDEAAPTALLVPILNYIGDSLENRFIESSAARIFLNHQDIIFTRPIHEQVTYLNGQLKYYNTDFFIFHTGYTHEVHVEKDKSTRNLSIFEDMSEKSIPKDNYQLFTLANEYMMIGNHKKALYYYERVYKRANKNESWFIHCTVQYIFASMELKRYKEAIVLIEEAIGRWGQYPDFYCYLGVIYKTLGFDDHAIQNFEKSLELAELASASSGKFWLVSPNFGSITPYMKLNEIFSKQGNLPKVIYCLSKIIGMNSSDSINLYRLLHLLSLSEPVDQIILFLDKFYPKTETTNLKLCLQMSLLLGHEQLSTFYMEQCHKAELELATTYRLRYAIISKDHDLFDSTFSCLSSTPEDLEYVKSLCLAACIWKDSQYLNAVDHQVDESFSAFKSILEDFIKESPSEDNYRPYLSTIASILIELFKTGHYDTYDWLINCVPNLFEELANHMANYFYTQHQTELALDYYSLLHNSNRLNAESYENLGWLYMNQGEHQEGLEFFKKSLELNPNVVSIYTAICTNTNNPSDKAIYKEKMFNSFPQYRGIPFLKTL